VLASYLESHPKISRVLYPGLPSHPQHELARQQMTQGGGLVCFDVAGDKEGCFRFMDALRLVDISNNLGDSKSLVTHPATTTHSRLKPEARAELGISDSLVFSGLEAQSGLLGDIWQHSLPFEEEAGMKSTVFLDSPAGCTTLSLAQMAEFCRPLSPTRQTHPAGSRE
jgi:cystathionine beta-lyase/cystathionine gamma-synthase